MNINKCIKPNKTFTFNLDNKPFYLNGHSIMFLVFSLFNEMVENNSSKGHIIWNGCELERKKLFINYYSTNNFRKLFDQVHGPRKFTGSNGLICYIGFGPSQYKRVCWCLDNKPLRNSVKSKTKLLPFLFPQFCILLGGRISVLGSLIFTIHFLAKKTV